ncbi:MAG TPA: hypothetical protein VFI31_03415 [Pirellulales bacterium]|nr:hypothetical protein [Pirellulales bacterium]
MIELTERQRQALAAAGEQPPTLIDPQTKAAYVLLPRPDYERIRELVYGDSPWSDEEMDLLAAEDADRLGWEGMEVYQDDRP